MALPAEACAIDSSIDKYLVALNQDNEAIQAIKVDFYNKVSAQYVSSGLVDGEIISNKIISRALNRIKSIPKDTPKTAIAAMLKKWNLQNYKIGFVDGRECLLKTVNNRDMVIVPWDTSFDIIWKTHLANVHPKGSKLVDILRKNYIVNKFVVECINKVCTVCIESKKPNIRTALYCVDMASNPDNTFSTIMVYEDLQTNFLHLRPIGSEDTNLEISMELFKIFMDFGPPVNVQICDASLVKVIDTVKRLISPCRIGISLVNSNHTEINRLTNLISNWIRENHCNNWGIGCHMLQWTLNNKVTQKKNKSPHLMVFKGYKMINEDSSEDEDLQKKNISTSLVGHGDATGHNISFGGYNNALEISLTLSKAFSDDEMTESDQTVELQTDNKEESKVPISEEDLKSEKSFSEDNDCTSVSPQPGPSHRSPVFDSTLNLKSSQSSSDNSTPEAIGPDDSEHGNFISGDLPIRTTFMKTDNIEVFSSDNLNNDLPSHLIDDNICIVCDKSVGSDSGVCRKCNRYVHLQCQKDTFKGDRTIKCKLCHKLDNLFNS